MGLFGGHKDEAAAAPVASAANKKRILLCEDDMFFRQALSLILGNAGYEIITAENGAKGVELLTAGPAFQLILCDIMMPELDGWGVLRKVVENPDWKIVPFIFLTGVSDISSMDRATEQGAKDYFIKANTGLPKIVELVKKYIN